MKHGGNLYEIAAAYQLKQEEIIDFSANINPLGVPRVMAEIIRGGIDRLIDYPDIHYYQLRECIGRKYGINTAHLHLGNGGAQVIFDFIRVVSPKKALVVSPTFLEYTRALQAVGAEIRHFYLLEAEDFRLNVGALINALDDGFDMVILCNPNNPTGGQVSKEDLLSLSEACSKKGIVLMIDEAFMDFIDQDHQMTMLSLCQYFNNLMITRSFTKFYGVPGLRLGFGATGNGKYLEGLKIQTIPWSLNYFASCFHRVLEEEGAYETETFQWLKREQTRMLEGLNELASIKVYPTAVNFILLRLLDPKMNCQGLNNLLLKEKILIREGNTFNGLNHAYVRVAVKDQGSNGRLLGAMGAILGKK